jgi:hypothetical protein
MRMYFAEKNPVWKLCLSTLYRLKLSPMPLHPVPDPIVISVEKKNDFGILFSSFTETGRMV